MSQSTVPSSTPEIPAPAEVAGPPRRWPWWAKWLVSLALVWHFANIIIHVVSSGISNLAAPLWTVALSQYGKPYLRSVYLTSSYRYFVPDPGPSFLLWFKITYKDGKQVSHRWVEFPSKENTGPWWLRMPYQRGLAVSALLGLGMVPHNVSERPKWIVQAPVQIWLASYARHIALKNPRLKPDGTPWPMVQVGIYGIFHGIRIPEYVRKGWEADDLRLYGMPEPQYYVPGTLSSWPIYLGAYTPDGVLAPSDQPEPRDNRGFIIGAQSRYFGYCKSIYELSMEIFEDLEQPGSDVENPDLPTPIRKLLITHSAELLDPRLRATRRERLENILRKKDRAVPISSSLTPGPPP